MRSTWDAPIVMAPTPRFVLLCTWVCTWPFLVQCTAEKHAPPLRLGRLHNMYGAAVSGPAHHLTAAGPPVPFRLAMHGASRSHTPGAPPTDLKAWLYSLVINIPDIFVPIPGMPKLGNFAIRNLTCTHITIGTITSSFVPPGVPPPPPSPSPSPTEH